MSTVNKKLAKSLAAAAKTPDTSTTVKLSSNKKTSPTSLTLTATPSVTKSSTKSVSGLHGYLLDHIDDGSDDPRKQPSGNKPVSRKHPKASAKGIVERKTYSLSLS